MTQTILEAVRATSSVYPLPLHLAYTYGTAGFRCKGDLLAPAAYRMGLLAAIRSKVCGGGSIGVMITASHNPAPDNGLKIVEMGGEMLAVQWENYATQIANTPETGLPEALVDLCEKLNVPLCKSKSSVIIGRDTRETGPEILAAIQSGVESLEARVTDVGICTTPQLHWIVKQTNLNQPATLTDYYSTFTTAFKKFSMRNTGRKLSIKVDCANGVGAVSLRAISPLLTELVDIEIHNDGSEGELNKDCGADFVKLMQNAPKGVSYTENDHCYTIDGDADRILFFYTENHRFHLLDGDKISCLLASYIRRLLDEAEMNIEVGVVQTAYANGSSTSYLRDQGVEVVCVPTGVKHLHAAAEKMDIGIYFEANGHGTVLFSNKALASINKEADQCDSLKGHRTPMQKLQNLTALINQACGDAVTNILVIEALLRDNRWMVCDWDGLYTDLPYRQLKVAVADRSLIKTFDAERQVSEPEGLQAQIDDLVGQYMPGARCFVRPSGTENCVRVHAECRSQRDADALSMAVGQLVFDCTENIIRAKL